MDNIHLISASAGSGKTYRLAELLQDEILGQRVRPEAVLATTFTRRAAAELEERVRRRLIEAGHSEAGLRLGAARIGTVNAVCGAIVGEFAFQLGLSPDLRVLDEMSARREMKAAVSAVVTPEESNALAALTVRMENFDWQGAVYDVITLARANMIPPDRLEACGEQSVSEMRDVLGKGELLGDGESGLARNQTLKKAIEACLPDLARDTTKTTRETREFLQGVAAQMDREGTVSWGDWLKMTTLTTAKASRDAMAPVTKAACAVDGHPHLQADVEEAIRRVIDLARRAHATYEARKRAAGTLDFVDQETLALRLLERPDVAEELRGKLDLLLVDEFQDTSPLQLAIFLRLAEIVPQTVWVGDQKQAIYGFRGTDPALMSAVLQSIEHASTGSRLEVLQHSYRSRPSLVWLTSDLFELAFARVGFAREQVRLSPPPGDTPDDLGPCAEIWLLSPGEKRRASADTDVNALADGIHAMLADDSVRVRDPQTGEVRGVVPHDIAVLCKTNDNCEAVAQALLRRGLCSVLARAGLLERPEAAIVLAGIRLRVDPNDSLAAAELARLVRHNTDPAGFLEAALHARGEAPFRDVAEVAAVLTSRKTEPSSGVIEALDQIIEAVQAREYCLRWGDCAQRIANLDALRAHCVSYVTSIRGTGHAATLVGLLSHLRRLAKNKEDAQATPVARGSVVVSTWHASKGLEWPIAVLTDLEHQRPADALGVRVVPAPAPERQRQPEGAGDAPADTVQHVLRNRSLRYWPDPFRKQQKRGLPVHGRLEAHPATHAAQEAADRESLRLLYVAWTRARDRVVLAGRPGFCARGILRHLCQGEEPLLTAPETPGTVDVTWAGRTFPLLVRACADPGDDALAPPDASTCESVTADGPRAHLPAIVVPSAPATESEEGAGTSESADVDAAAGPSPASAAASDSSAKASPASAAAKAHAGFVRIGEALRLGRVTDMAVVGDVVHGFLAADRSDLSEAERFETAAGLLSRWKIGAAMAPRALMRAGDALRKWVDGRWPGARWRREWPLSQRLPNGQLVRGICDLMLETPDGFVVIDHKSFPGNEQQAVARALTHRHQVQAYADVLRSATGQAFLGGWIHLPVVGIVVEVCQGSGETT